MHIQEQIDECNPTYFYKNITRKYLTVAREIKCTQNVFIFFPPEISHIFSSHLNNNK